MEDPEDLYYTADRNLAPSCHSPVAMWIKNDWPIVSSKIFQISGEPDRWEINGST